MVKLGSWPEDRYFLSWMTQRLANRAPEYTHLRRWPFSIGQQLMNPMAIEIQETNQQLYEERNNIFLTSANINLIDKLYRVELNPGMTFNLIESTDGVELYSQPTVYATIGTTEHEITIAKRNDIQSLWYEAIPSRLTDAEESYVYEEVIPRSSVSSLSSLTPSSMSIYGHLYITVRDNTSWSYNGRAKKYYSKVFIKGTTRKGTDITEAVPILYNGTFKTINQWKEVESVFVSYMDSTASVTVEVMPFDQETALDTHNLIIFSNDIESRRFLRLGERLWGSTLISEGFTVQEIETIQLGIDAKDIEYEIELHDSLDQNITALAAAQKPNTDYMFIIDNTKLYIYDTKLPYPDVKQLSAESTNTKMDLYSDRWIYSRDDTVTVTTDNLDVSTPPWQFRWTLQEPDDTISYLNLDGSKLPTTTDAWIWNDKWEEGFWKEQNMEILLDQLGVYIITIECLYSDPDKPDKDYTRTTRFLLYTSSIQPEVTIDLPTNVQDAEGLMFDSDGTLWALKSDSIYKLNVLYDYYLVDYERNAVLLRENYSSVRVVL